MRHVLCVLGLFGFVPTSFSYEIQDIFHTSKKDLDQNELSSSHFEITEDEISKQDLPRAVDILKQVPGIDYSQTGITGGESSVFIRGLEGKHTLILIDGVKVYDPANPNKTLNLSILNSLDIEKVEVLKGPQSVLYGSNAIGGVINFITKKSVGKNTLLLEGGYSQQGQVQNSFTGENSTLYLAGNYQESRYLSEVNSGDEVDKQVANGFTLGHIYESGRTEFDSSIKYSRSFSETDGNRVDDDSAYAFDEYLFIKESINHKWSEKVDIDLDISLHKVDRGSKYYDSFTLDDYKLDEYSSFVYEQEWRVTSQQDKGTLVYGLDSIREIVSNDPSLTVERENNIFDLYFDHSKRFTESFTYNYGVRNTSNNRYGNHLVYNIGAVKNFKQSSLRTSLGTGFKTPTISQLYDPQYGNRGLAPEKSKTFELGHTYEYTHGLRFESSYFYTEVEDLIGFDSNSEYANIDSGIYQGIELGGDYSHSNWSLGSYLTLLNIKQSNGKEATRRPNYSLLTNFNYHFNEHKKFNITWNWKGRRFDIDQKVMASYSVVDFNYHYNMANYQLGISIKNLFDEKYEIARDYSTLDRSFKLSLTYRY